MGSIRSARCVLGLLALCACATWTAFGQDPHSDPPAGNSHELIEQSDTLSWQDPEQGNDIGGFCRNSNHCRPELCCLLSRDNSRTCQPKALMGEQCTEDQVKGGAYQYHCPCLEGICSLIVDDRHDQGGNETCVPSEGQRPQH